MVWVQTQPKMSDIDCTNLGNNISSFHLRYNLNDLIIFSLNYFFVQKSYIEDLIDILLFWLSLCAYTFVRIKV